MVIGHCPDTSCQDRNNNDQKRSPEQPNPPVRWRHGTATLVTTLQQVKQVASKTAVLHFDALVVAGRAVAAAGRTVAAASIAAAPAAVWAITSAAIPAASRIRRGRPATLALQGVSGIFTI